MTIGTQPLTADETWREIDAMITFLRSLAIERVEITYGWGCNAVEIAQPVVVAVDDLPLFLQNNIAQGVYHLGEDNFYITGYITGAEPSLVFTLCHDADIHFKADNAALEVQLRGEWEARGYRVWPKAHTIRK